MIGRKRNNKSEVLDRKKKEGSRLSLLHRRMLYRREMLPENCNWAALGICCSGQRQRGQALGESGGIISGLGAIREALQLLLLITSAQ